MTLTVLTVSWFSGPACCSFSLIQCCEKYPLKALRKRCRWMLVATSFQKLLMNISGSLSSQCLHTHLPPTSLVRQCEMGTAHSVLQICWCNKTLCLRLLSSICNRNIKSAHAPNSPQMRMACSFKPMCIDFHDIKVLITLKAMPVSCNKGIFLAF